MGASHMGGVGMGENGRTFGPEARRQESMGAPRMDMSRMSPDTALTKSPKLASNLDKLLPNGMTAQQACSGFKNLGQCVAAIHVSHNLDIPFADLKAKMTGDHSLSLGKTIHELKPTTNAKAEAKKANKEAKKDIKTVAS